MSKMWIAVSCEVLSPELTAHTKGMHVQNKYPFMRGEKTRDRRPEEVARFSSIKSYHVICQQPRFTFHYTKCIQIWTKYQIYR
jgi:hypothetical protein